MLQRIKIRTRQADEYDFEVVPKEGMPVKVNVQTIDKSALEENAPDSRGQRPLQLEYFYFGKRNAEN